VGNISIIRLRAAPNGCAKIEQLKEVTAVLSRGGYFACTVIIHIAAMNVKTAKM
jgi:hypothetical protein